MARYFGDGDLEELKDAIYNCDSPVEFLDIYDEHDALMQDMSVLCPPEVIAAFKAIKAVDPAFTTIWQWLEGHDVSGSCPKESAGS